MQRHFPESLRYTEDHEWARVDGNVVTVGITWHAQDALGDIVHCELPGVGEGVTAGEPFGVVESVKAVSDLLAPVSGKVLERNEAVTESPEGLNEDCYDDGWMIRIEMSDPSELKKLMDAGAYVQFLDDAED